MRRVEWMIECEPLLQAKLAVHIPFAQAVTAADLHTHAVNRRFASSNRKPGRAAVQCQQLHSHLAVACTVELQPDALTIKTCKEVLSGIVKCQHIASRPLRAPGLR